MSAGHGDQIGQNVLLTWHDAIPSFVNAITMSTAKSQGRWRVGFMGIYANTCFANLFNEKASDS